ncbi:hypothetical protein ABXT08_18250 [Chryseobacterium sp. NRRL B-14859]|uniref:hypothetical protein n=1 Tax=Chryseobacterium sp. NRRL B-14859 TaxID=1562763 RepID=UPI00339B444B
MKTIFFLIITLCIVSCATRKRSITYFLSSGIENSTIFPATKIDSTRIDEIEQLIEKNLEKCREKKNSICIDDRGVMTLFMQSFQKEFIILG